MRTALRLLGVGLGLLAPHALEALERPTPAQIAQYRKDGSFASRLDQARQIGNHQADPRLVAGLGDRLRRQQQGLLPGQPVLPPNWQGGMPTKGTVRAFALLISFSDYAPSNTAASIDAKLFGDGLSPDYPRESLRNYYRRASYNQLELQGVTLGWYAAPYPRSSVPQTTAGREALIKEALGVFDAAGHDFSQYDNDGNGSIDYFIVIWTGPDNGWANFWWGYKTPFYDGSYQLDGKRLLMYSWQWEALPAGRAFAPYVVIHETGHALGLPDYYDYDDTVGPRGGVGGLDMMDGNWGDHNCFSKALLDWITPTVISGDAGVVSLRPSGTSGQAIVFATGATSDPFTEYFMLQNRTRVANDTGYPADGFLVWHVDATLDGGNLRYDNSYTAHKLLRLMEADGLEQIEAGGAADAGDYYVSGRSLTQTTRPSSVRYSGPPNTLQVTDVSAAGDPMTARIGAVTDATAPAGVPGAPGDEGASTPLTRLVFTWTPGSLQDPETGIASYQLQVGTAPGAADVFDGWVGNVLTWTLHDLPEGSTYYARVRAANGAGLTSAWTASSDGIAVTAPAAFPCAALDNCDLAFRTSGDALWQEQGSVVHDGATAAQSGDVGDGESTFLEVQLTGPGTLSFWWRVSCQGYADALSLYLDGSGFRYLTGETGWVRETVSIASGPHVVRWVYWKDPGGSSGQDTGWVDGVSWSPPPGFSIDDVTVAEGDSGTTLAAFTVTLSYPPVWPGASVSWVTSNGTAAAFSDYVFAYGTLHFGAGETTKTIEVSVNGDTLFEPDETFAVDLSSAWNASIADAQGVGTITNDDSPSPPFGFYPLVPCRLVDTRDPDGPHGGPALQAGAARFFSLPGRCGVPATARAVSLNATVTQPTERGHVRLYPADQAVPNASNLNYAADQTRANNAVVQLSPAGELGVYCGQASGAAHFVLDVNGYFQ